jgi:hypothetical protein
MIHRPQIVNTSDILPIIVSEDLRSWGVNLGFLGDVFCYNILSASKFLNELIRKEGEKFELVAVHDHQKREERFASSFPCALN